MTTSTNNQDPDILTLTDSHSSITAEASHSGHASRSTSYDQEELEHVYPSPMDPKSPHHVSTFDEYKSLYNQSTSKTNEFWDSIARNNFYWKQPWTNVNSFNFDTSKGDVFIKWFENGQTNICYNALDRNVKELNRGDQVAFYWYGKEKI